MLKPNHSLCTLRDRPTGDTLLDIPGVTDETAGVRARNSDQGTTTRPTRGAFAHSGALARSGAFVTISFALGLIALTASGCGALLLVGGAGTSAIAFATGELRTTEDRPLAEVDRACESATERLGYDDVRAERSADRIRWQATTAGGEPVVIRLLAEGPSKTDLRIRIGTFGDEAASRLVLEEIHQSF